jgi:hypothetical protein
MATNGARGVGIGAKGSPHIARLNARWAKRGGTHFARGLRPAGVVRQFSLDWARLVILTPRGNYSYSAYPICPSAHRPTAAARLHAQNSISRHGSEETHTDPSTPVLPIHRGCRRLYHLDNSCFCSFHPWTRYNTLYPDQKATKTKKKVALKTTTIRPLPTRCQPRETYPADSWRGATRRARIWSIEDIFSTHGRFEWRLALVLCLDDV